MICDPAEKQAVVVEFMPLVRHVVNRICRGQKYQPADVDEMMSDGAIGLMDAVDKFDPDRGFKFQTYAQRRIWGQIKDGWRERDPMPRLMRKREENLPTTHSLDSVVPFQHDQRRDYTWSENLEDHHAGDARSHLESTDTVKRLMKGLGAHERFAIELYYLDGLTMKEIGQTIGLSESRVSQMIKQSLTILRAKLTAA